MRPLRDSAQGADEPARGGGVEILRRLVKDQAAGIAEERAGAAEDEAVCLTGRQAGRDPCADGSSPRPRSTRPGRAGLATGDGERLQELYADHPAPLRDGNLRARGTREGAEGSLRRAQQEVGV